MIVTGASIPIPLLTSPLKGEEDKVFPLQDEEHNIFPPLQGEGRVGVGSNRPTKISID
jgi:hypothetical protein